MERTDGTTEALVTRANAWCRAHGYPPVTTRQFRDWVTEGLLPPTVPHGRRRGLSPTWEHSALQYRRTLQICRFRAQGLHYRDQWRVSLWLRRGDWPFPAIRDALLRQMRRDRHELERHYRSLRDPRLNPTISVRQGRAASRVIAEAATGGDRQAVFGMLESRPVEWLDAITHGMPLSANAMGPVTLPLASGMLSVDEGFAADLATSVFAGLLADPDLVSPAAEDTVAQAELATFLQVRDWVRTLRAAMPWLGPFAQATLGASPSVSDWLHVADTVGSPEDDTRLVAVWLHFVAQRSDAGQGLFLFGRHVLRPTVRLCRFLENSPYVRRNLAEALAVPDSLVAILTTIPDVVALLVARAANARSRFRILWRTLRHHGMEELLHARKVVPTVPNP